MRGYFWAKSNFKSKKIVNIALIGFYHLND